MSIITYRLKNIHLGFHRLEVGGIIKNEVKSLEFIRYIRILIGFLAYMAYAPFFTRKVYKLSGEDREKYIRFHVSKWGRRAFEWAKSEVTIIGSQNIPKNGPYIIVANHRSMLDITLIQGYINPHAGFLAKKELDHFFSVGAFIKALGGELIDRSNPRDAIRAINNLIKRMKTENQVVALFPEGTRSIDGEVHEFKGGSMKVVMKSKVPVVPIAIVGTDKAMPKGTFYIRRANIKVSVLPPIAPESFKDMKTIEFANLLQGMISKEVKKLEGGEGLVKRSQSQSLSS